MTLEEHQGRVVSGDRVWSSLSQTIRPQIVSRRRVLAGLAAGVGAALLHAQTTIAAESADTLERLEKEVGGRIGLAVLDTANGNRLSHRADERFAMCSTFKLMLAAAILFRIDSGTLHLDQSVSFARSDLLSNSPIAEAYPAGGAVPLQMMLESVIEASDNTAANLLLAMVGGPAGYTGFLRGIGDSTTRLDRIELDLNSNLPGDQRDTTTPNAMLEDMNRVLLGNRLSAGSRKLLLRWMRDCKTGHERLRSRLPKDWEAGDKTGTGERGAVNDLAIFLPPKRAPILVACYLSESTASWKELSAVHAQIGALIASTMS